MRWRHVPLSVVRGPFFEAHEGLRPAPWVIPPAGMERGLMVLTSNYNLYLIPTYDELYRIMVRDGALKYVHEIGAPDELIIEAYMFNGARSNASTTVRTSSPAAVTPDASNVIPFPKKPR